ncbi:MAG: hypothetical protein A3K10_14940 [Bacteroidetes bacterium RIFCSPLOWO2_12_FULL_31_6]|nr:MAG: hypothetical protein A3K10_14940 [Bacteroidetes bacterium RIFCSPLOWO2_12_FULL_31_6]
MKLRFIYILALLFFIQTEVKAQCGGDDFMDFCAEVLGDFNFIKANKINLSNADTNKDTPTVQYAQVLSTNNTYCITACYSGSGNMILELYDRDHKLIMSNYDKVKKKYYPVINYICSATGVYYFVYSFSGVESACGISMIGVK